MSTVTSPISINHHKSFPVWTFCSDKHARFVGRSQSSYKHWHIPFTYSLLMLQIHSAFSRLSLSVFFSFLSPRASNGCSVVVICVLSLVVLRWCLLNGLFAVILNCGGLLWEDNDHVMQTPVITWAKRCVCNASGSLSAPAVC